jgi:hypothetical protein
MLGNFFEWYNNEHRHIRSQGMDGKTPMQAGQRMKFPNGKCLGTETLSFYSPIYTDGWKRRDLF